MDISLRGSGTGSRTPIVWTRTRCPTIRRFPNIKFSLKLDLPRRSLSVGGRFPKSIIKLTIKITFFQESLFFCPF